MTRSTQAHLNCSEYNFGAVYYYFDAVAKLGLGTNYADRTNY